MSANTPVNRLLADLRALRAQIERVQTQKVQQDRKMYELRQQLNAATKQLLGAQRYIDQLRRSIDNELPYLPSGDVHQHQEQFRLSEPVLPGIPTHREASTPEGHSDSDQ